ncbi:MAG: RtcB family protein [Candidatus Dojkabacteria bacterium]
MWKLKGSKVKFGEMVWVHRKGAISAKSDEAGIIPGSMATYSYITSGLGNPDCFHSASHGAGRALGRKEAKRRYTKEDVLRDLDTHDIKIFAADNAGMIEEYSKSYKDVEKIIELQADLVKVKHRLFPMLVVIG